MIQIKHWNIGILDIGKVNNDSAQIQVLAQRYDFVSLLNKSKLI